MIIQPYLIKITGQGIQAIKCNFFSFLFISSLTTGLRVDLSGLNCKMYGALA